MGFVKIFWKNNVHEAYLPKISILGANCLWDRSPVMLTKLHTNPSKFFWGRPKTTVRFPYNEFVPTMGFKNVVELSKICLGLHLSMNLIPRENSACYCLHLASNLDAVSSNSKAVFGIASLWDVVYKVEDQKWVEVAVRQQSLCLLLEGGVSWKSRALPINCRISKHSSAILWVDG